MLGLGPKDEGRAGSVSGHGNFVCIGNLEHIGNLLRIGWLNNKVWQISLFNIIGQGGIRVINPLKDVRMDMILTN